MNEIQRKVYWTKLSSPPLVVWVLFEWNGQSGPRRSSLVQILLHRPPAGDDIMQKNPLFASRTILSWHRYCSCDAHARRSTPALLLTHTPQIHQGRRVHRSTPDGFKRLTISQAGCCAFVPRAPNTGTCILRAREAAKVNPRPLKDNQNVLLGNVWADLWIRTRRPTKRNIPIIQVSAF